MFVGRERELSLLDKLYASDRFEFLILYGRRRVGKTTLLLEFAKTHHVLFFSAQEKNDVLNLEDFSKVVQTYFNGVSIAPFQGWEQAFEFIAGKLDENRTCIVIDEFPFLAQANPSVKSILQHAIDHSFSQSHVMLVLCGSSVSFMEREVMGYESPLYGRSTSQFELQAFDYLESARFFENYSYEQKLVAYGVLGGIPRYLREFDDRAGVFENVAERILEPGAFLNEEPQALLRMEVREPARYNAILQAIAGGVNRGTEISDRVHEEQPTVGKYLATLKGLRLISKRVPCGESNESKKGIYELSDNFLRFWYRFVFPNKGYYELLGSQEASKEIEELSNDYMGPIFEHVCEQYLRRLAKKRKLPFVPFHLGKWWGNNPSIRAQDDIDVLGLSKDGTKGIFCECKFKNRELTMEDYDDLVNATRAFPAVKECHLYLFSKGGFTKPVQERAAHEGTVLVGIEDLFV